jgi:propanediol utilization protein pduL
MKIRVGVSNRHIHLCKHDADILFGSDYIFQKRNDLSQEGEYACMETVRVWTNKGEFSHVRVIGPLREYTQVEVSEDDARVLGINPPMRNSGMLQDSESVWVGGPNGEKFIKNCCIKANRHIHCNTLDNIGHNNRDIVKVKFNDIIIDNVHIKMGDKYKLEMHIDKSDAEKYGIENGDYIELE